MILSLEPIFAATTSFIVFQESLSSLEIFGGLAIVLGLIIYNLLNSKSEIVSKFSKCIRNPK
jgi:drug/metabolite transporter (DMT)-like permease